MNTRLNCVRTVFTSAAIALFAVLFMASGTAQASTSAWTGCVTPGGTIVHLALGDAPSQPCSQNMGLVHLRDTAAYQHTEANYEQAKMCEALHSLGLDPTHLADLGCPSTPTLTRPGTVTRVHSQDYRDNVTAGNGAVCGIFAIEQNNTAFDFVVKGGFVDSTQPVPFIGGSEACRVLCVGDDKCIAAFYSGQAGTVSAQTPNVGTCRVFHYSDQLNDDWGHYCGFTEDLTFPVPMCIGTLSGDPKTGWFVRVPDGQTVDNCPGVTPTP